MTEEIETALSLLTPENFEAWLDTLDANTHIIIYRVFGFPRLFTKYLASNKSHVMMGRMLRKPTTAMYLEGCSYPFEIVTVPPWVSRLFLPFLENRCSEEYPDGRLGVSVKLLKEQLREVLKFEQDFVRHAAIKIGDLVFIGYRHHNIFKTLDECHYDVMSRQNGEQGFVTYKGHYLNREDAAELAYQAGQIKEKKKELFSEDLY